MQGSSLDAAVFSFAFAAAFLLTGRHPVLARSTRTLLVGLIGSALAFQLVPQEPWHGCIGAATLIANAVFVGFAVIDFARRRASDRAES